MRRVLAILLLLPLLAGVSRAEEEGEAELQRLARKQLLLRARASVDPSNPSVGGLADIRRLTQQQREAFKDAATGIFERLDSLVGTTEEAPGGASEGLIPQGARLHRWVTGQLLPSERHEDVERVKTWRAERIDARLEEAKAAHAADAKEGDPAFDEEAARKRIREEVLALPVPADIGGDAKKPGFLLLPDDGAPLPLPATPPPEASRLDAATRAALVTSTLEIDRAKGTGSAGSVIDLEGIRLLWRAAGTEPGGDSWRFPLVRPDELAWIESSDFVGWRRLQVALRREARADQAVPSLVSDADVEVRRTRVEEARREQARLESRIRSVLAAFDLMAEAESVWQREVGRLGFEIENLVSECEDCSPDEEAKLKRGLALKQLEERAAQQELRLLYVTATRAEARLELLRKALALASEEVVQAEASLQRYVDAQSRTRRETQLAELRLQAKDLAKQRAAFERLAQREELTAEERQVNATLQEAAERMLALNERLTKVVRLRQTLEARAAGKSEVERGRNGAEEAAAAEEAQAATPGEGGADAAKTVETPAVDPLASVRRPQTSELNASYIQLVQEKLSHPAFDADLVAAHYAAADDSLEALQSAMDEVASADLGLDAFERIASEIETRIRVEDSWNAWYSQELRKMRASFADSVEAIRRKQTQIRERMTRLEAWKDELESQGVRSFAIRKNRSLGGEALADAGDDLASTWRDAVAWVGFEREEHLGTFVGSRWMALLVLAGILVVSLLLVRYGRHWIDERLTRMAQRVPALRREPITVSAEAQEAKQQRAAIEAARREAEEAALKDAAGEGEKGAVRGSAGEAGEGA